MKRLVPLLRIAWCLALLGCSPGEPPDSPATPTSDWPTTARGDMVQALQSGLQAQYDPSDGGGRAWIVPPIEPIMAGQAGRWELQYEAGPLGIAEGGVIFLQVSPFWGWSTPQVTWPDRLGYTEVALLHTQPDSAEVELEPITLDEQLLGIQVHGGPLPAGERVRITYGSGSAGARADRYAEHESRFWFAVDGDGDGVRRVLPESPTVQIQARPPSQMLLHLQSTATPEGPVALTIALLDSIGNAGYPVSGEIRLQVPAGLELPDRVQMLPEWGGHHTLHGVALLEGIYRIGAVGPDGLDAESNPLMVSTEGYPVHWGDIHGHSNLSDGTGTPDDYYTYAREVAGLQVSALTDHDHWGMLFLDQTPALWSRITETARRHHDPGRFVTLLGYEWTSWVWGHRHVLYFQDEGTVYSTLDPRYDEPEELWAALQGQDAITIAHHSAGGPIATDWRHPPPPALEPITEIVSVHGSSEAPDSPAGVYSLVADNTVRDALVMGYPLGFVGSGDSHDGHPGLVQLAAVSGGVTAFLTRDLSRVGIRETLFARRTYATNGPRILLRVTLNGLPMGSDIPEGSGHLVAAIFGTAPVERVDLVSGHSGDPHLTVESLAAEGERDLFFEIDIQHLSKGGFLYLRVVQRDGGAAWSSPFFVRAPKAG